MDFINSFIMLLLGAAFGAFLYARFWGRKAD